MTNGAHPLFGTPLPQRWEVRSVNEVRSAEPSSCVAGPFGSNISSKYFVDAGVPVIRGSNLRDDLTRFVPQGFVYVSEERARAYAAQHVHGGDLVFTCWGTVGQVGLIPHDGPHAEYIISNKQLKLRPDPSVADSLYLFYFFASPEMVQHVRSRAIGAAVPGINLGILKALPVVLPPLAEQRRIAGVLSAYDDLIENCERRIRVLDGMARALYREWFVHFRYPGEEHVPLLNSRAGRLPSNWVCGRLDDVLVLQRGFDLPKDQREVGRVPIVAAAGLNGTHSASKVSAPGVATGRSGSIGTVLYLQEDFWPLNTTLWAKAFPKSEPLFAFFTLASVDLAQFNSGAAVPTLNRNDVHGLPVGIPPRHQQIRFQEEVGTLLRQQKVLEGTRDKLRKIRDLLLPRLLSGQLSVDALE